jgi:hypothetical protein
LSAIPSPSGRALQRPPTPSAADLADHGIAAELRVFAVPGARSDDLAAQGGAFWIGRPTWR